MPVANLEMNGTLKFDVQLAGNGIYEVSGILHYILGGDITLATPATDKIIFEGKVSRKQYELICTTLVHLGYSVSVENKIYGKLSTVLFNREELSIMRTVKLHNGAELTIGAWLSQIGVSFRKSTDEGVGPQAPYDPDMRVAFFFEKPMTNDQFYRTREFLNFLGIPDEVTKMNSF